MPISVKALLFIMAIIPIDNIGRRYFKFIINSRWTKEIYFNNEKKLIDFINKKNPEHCYYSLSKRIARNIIACDLVLDFDNINKKHILKSIEVFGEPRFLLETSKSSFQMHFQDVPLKENLNWLKLIKEHNIETDESVLRDREKRVCRLPYPHRKGEFKPRLLSIEDFKSYEYDINPKKKIQKEKIFYNYKGIKSTLDGKKDLQILVFKNPSISRLKRIQKIYQTGNLYLLKFPNDIYACSLKLFSLKRCQKIYKSYGKSFEHKFRFLRTSEKIYNGKIIEAGCEPLKILEQKAGGLYSLPHTTFISSLGFRIDRTLNFIGKPSIPIYELKIRGNLK